MSNKLLAALILVFIFFILIGWYVYFFVLYGSTLVFQGNVEDFDIRLSTEKLKTDFQYNCRENICSYQKVPPFLYTLTISKDWFEDYISQIEVPKNWETKIVFSLQESVELQTVTTLSDEPKSTQELLEDKKLRLKYRNFYLYYDFKDQWVFYMRDYQWKLFLYHDLVDEERLVADFEKVWKDNIRISPIHGTTKFALSIWWQNSLFDIQTRQYRGIDLKQQILYGKKWIDSDEIILVTEVWSYIYNLQKYRSEYFVLFHDFVYIDNNTLLWLIVPTDTKRKENLSLDSAVWNTLYRYDMETQGLREVYASPQDIDQFYLDSKDDLIIDIEGNTKRLTNY